MARTTPFINKDTLIKIYKRLKADPLKVWVATDLGDTPTARKHLNVLISLELVEEVRTIYRQGKRHIAKRGVKGYKLIPKETFINRESVYKI